MKCSMGYLPCQLKVRRNVCLAGQPPMATIMDYKPENITSFSMCHLTDPFPKPCKPIIDNAWVGGKNDYTIGNQPALLKSSKCFCKNGGVIQIIDDGQKGENPWIDKQSKTEYDTRQPDKIIIWDVYWEKKLEKDGKEQDHETKIRFLPQLIELVNLAVVYYYKFDNENYNKDGAKIVIEIPGTCLDETKEFPLNNREAVGDLNGHTLYKTTIKNFTFDLKALEQ